MGIFKIFTSHKSFALPVIGSPTLNKLGLHTARIRLANLFLSFRRFQVAGFARPSEYKTFQKDGIVVLEDFLPEEDFKDLVQQLKNTINSIDESHPIQNYGDLGFGQKHIFDWGFDRYDGNTLNRFYTIKSDQNSIQAFINHPKLKQLTTLFAGTYHDPSKYLLYKLFHGKENGNADSQKDIHRDTFHSAIKLWYFVEDVKPEHGPFHYAFGSHKLTPKRLAWEKQKSIRASKHNKGGAFRINAKELKEIGQGEVQALPVKANTLVIADIRGFHCRGKAHVNQERLSIYANIRPAPFLPAFNASRLRRFIRFFS